MDMDMLQICDTKPPLDGAVLSKGMTSCEKQRIKQSFEYMKTEIKTLKHSSYLEHSSKARHSPCWNERMSSKFPLRLEQSALDSLQREPTEESLCSWGLID